MSVFKSQPSEITVVSFGRCCPPFGIKISRPAGIKFGKISENFTSVSLGVIGPGFQDL